MLGWFLLGLGLSFALGFLLGIQRRSGNAVQAPPSTIALPHDAGVPAGELYAIAESLSAPIEQTAHPKDAMDLPDFKRGVAVLSDPAVTLQDVLTYFTGTNWILSCIAGEALCHREDEDASETVLAPLHGLGPWPMYFALKYLTLHRQGPLIGPVLAQAQEWWPQAPAMNQMLSELIAKRTAQGEKPTFGNALEPCSSEALLRIGSFLQTLESGHAAALLAELTGWQRSRVDKAALETVGRVWEHPPGNHFVQHAAQMPYLQRIEECLEDTPPRSVLLVGEAGVGKTALVHVLAERLRERGWTIFEAGASDVMAGQMRIGELEERIKELLDNLRTDRRILWYAPNFHELLYAGVHQYSPVGVLDLLLPAIENRGIAVIGETTPQGYERLEQHRKRLQTAAEAIRVQALSDRDTLALAQEWATRTYGGESADAALLKEAFNLAKQHLTEKRPPGNLLQFLQLTHTRVSARKAAARPPSSDDLLGTLSRLTGLPKGILDDRQVLRLSELRQLFEQRIIGQPEAVDCLVDRVAMLKAGLTDPSRPPGVFLFVGPTGTGKTEIAKTLARYLFGAPERMIRLDMSEFQDPESLGRILGEADTHQAANALVNMIRKQPFSVVLLDEFEKAHHHIWDLFLQVFDDGRLTDRAGNLADFRHSIIILTSNLGATLSAGTSIGFTRGNRSFSPSTVEKAVADTFRPEFVNRIDRVVVFHPLSRRTMREILQKELNDVLLRRGFRKRQWAVEWDESALDFLLDRGFTPELGARPLKRAIERYLLSPLAVTIVEHRYPEGDQFLFVSSDKTKFNVAFVDPDAPTAQHPTSPETPPSEAQLRGLELRAVAFDPIGTPAELMLLTDRFESLIAVIDGKDWQEQKGDALAKTGAAAFWDDPDHNAVLSKIELMDRIESGLQTAGSLLKRLNRPRSASRTSLAPDLLRRLAQQLYLLDIAHRDLVENRSLDAFISVETSIEAQTQTDSTIEFFLQIDTMYRQWAEKRRMRLDFLQEAGGVKDCCRSVMAVAGFGAFSILRPEAGFHVLEIPRVEHKSFTRCRVRVRVAPQPEVYARDNRELLLRAEEAFAQLGDKAPTVVRRYRLKPSPLVRDSVRDWRTGRLDHVLAGDFDLIT